MKEENKTTEKATGRYVYDKKLGKVVKISDEIVGLKKSDDLDMPENHCEHQDECGYEPDTGCAGGSCPYDSE